MSDQHFFDHKVQALAAEQERLRDALGAISKLFLSRSITYEEARNLDIVIGRSMWVDYYNRFCKEEMNDGSREGGTDYRDSDQRTRTADSSGRADS